MHDLPAPSVLFALALLPLLVASLGTGSATQAQQRAQQGAEEPAGGEGEQETPERRVIPAKPGPSSDTIALTQPTEGFLLEDAVVQASSRSAVHTFHGRGPFVGTTLRNVLLHVAPDTLPLDRSYWGFRGYELVDTLLEDVEVTGFGRVTPKHDEGHALYLNPSGSLEIVGGHIHHNGGQALQLVNRPGETKTLSGPAEGTITVRRTRITENGFNPDRAGFQVSIFGTGQAILMEDVEITAGFDAQTWRGGKTRGGLLIEAEPFQPDRRAVWWHPADPPEDFVPPFAQGRTELRRVTVRHENPDRPIVQIRGCEELVVRDSRFAGGKIVLDRPGAPGPECGRIEWRGNEGSATLYHRGQPVGRASDDFLFPSESEGSPEEAAEEGAAGAR